MSKNQDVVYMQRALDLALRAKGNTSPNPLVGAVVVGGGKVVAEGWHHYCGGDHAEVIALKKAGEKAKGATLYVTLEPCSHFGRTPPCVDKILSCGIREVVIGMTDPNPLNNGKSIKVLRTQGMNVRVGFLVKELKKINEGFIKYITTHTPFVTVKCAQTLDGKIATAAGQSQWITAPKTRDYAHRLRNDFDAVLVGINTALKDDPQLNAARKNKRLTKIIVDSHLRLPLDAKLFKGTRPEDIIVATTHRASRGQRDRWARQGVSVLVCPIKDNGVDLKYLFKELGKREIAHLLIEGGGRMIGSALKEGLVDKLLLFLAPKILGDERALDSVVGFQAKHVGEAVRFKDLTIGRIGEDILIEAYPASKMGS